MQESECAQDLVRFLNRAPTPWHAVGEVKRRLVEAGFREIFEHETFHVKPGERVFVIRGGSTIAAFAIGNDVVSAVYRLVGAHTDSPCLRLKPNPVYSRSGHFQLGVEVYGGVLYHTWLDRDLRIAGRITVENENGVEDVLVAPIRASARVSSLAIHLNRQVNQDGLVLNAQSHLAPHFGLELAGKTPTLEDLLQWSGGRILGTDLCLLDAQDAAFVGLYDDYIASGRLDNLASCHAAVSSLLRSLEVKTECSATRGFVLFDHEECGSQSRLGADGPFLRSILERFSPSNDDFARAIAHSFFVSADMAHAVHPNYADRHEPNHAPIMGRGPVIKSNANQRYATDGNSAARFTKAAEDAGVRVQNFVTRTDLACGTTIGPITASLLGMSVVDVGNPMFSMHSARELCGSGDVHKMVAALTSCLAS